MNSSLKTLKVWYQLDDFAPSINDFLSVGQWLIASLFDILQKKWYEKQILSLIQSLA